MLLIEFENCVRDLGTLHKSLSTALSADSGISSFANVSFSRLPQGLVNFFRVLYHLESRLVIMGWIGGLLVEEMSSIGNPETSFISAKKMYSSPNSANLISGQLTENASAWLHISMALSTEMHKLFSLLLENRLSPVFLDFKLAFDILRSAFAELWVPLSSVLKRFCLSTGKE